jgi:hypothetical protein
MQQHWGTSTDMIWVKFWNGVPRDGKTVPKNWVWIVDYFIYYDNELEYY